MNIFSQVLLMNQYCNKSVLSLTHKLILKCMSNIVHACLVYKHTTLR